MRLRKTLPLIALLPSVSGAQTLQEFSFTKKDSARVVAFASGDAKTVLSQPKDALATTGSVGVTFIGENFIVSGVVNAPPKIDTVTAAYGASLLAPAAGKRTSALLDVRWRQVARLARPCDPARKDQYHCKIDWHTYIGVSGARWGSQPGADGKPTIVEDVSARAFAAGPSYVFFDGWIGERDPEKGTRIGMTLDALFATRTIRGNLGMKADSARRTELLGTKGRSFGGGEFALNIRYNEAQASLTYYHMAGSIRGFSGGQVVAGVSFRTRLNHGLFKDGL